MNRLAHILKGGWNSLADLFYPPVCIQCGNLLQPEEDTLCHTCLQHLPRTEQARYRGNRTEQLLWDIPKLERGAAFCFYRPHSDFRRLIHLMKYSNRPKTGFYLGKTAAQEFAEARFFEGIDLIVPVPLHKQRQRQRGYNQAEWIARGIAEATRIPMDNTHLKRKVNNPSQTHKSKEERQHNTDEIFTVDMPANWRGKHILLVDDIVTTGATLRACIHAISPIRGTRISIMTLGIAAQPNFS